MAFKVSNEECEQIVRGNYSDVFEKELEKLWVRLEVAPPEEVIKLQGRIYELKQIMGLKAKARAQLI